MEYPGFQLSSGLRRGSAADPLQKKWVRIAPMVWIFVLCVVSNDIRQHAGKSKPRNKYG
jgi:hypothetical protein